jgi:hypothetical protein
VHTRPTLVVATLLTALAAVASCSGSSDHAAQVIPNAAPVHWVVSLGDSYIAGEGDRWGGNSAANSTAEYQALDVLGPFAYAGTAGLEDIAGCHRATQPEVAVDYGDVKGMNFACSGAETSTKFEGTVFKPGIDFYAKGGKIGQAEALERFAKTHDVTSIVLSIGGNDFNFSAILTKCVQDFFNTSATTPTYCSQDPKLAEYFTPSRQAEVKQRIEGAIANIRTAMERAGSKPSEYRIIVQNYPSPLPPGADLRYAQTAAARFDKGGCPFFDRDATWANTTALAAINDTVDDAAAESDTVSLLDVSRAFVGHRLCEQGAEQIEDSGLSSWRASGAANQLEWVNQVYVKGIPWQTQESAHPNYWGTAAERNCLRQVVKSSGAGRFNCVHEGTAMTGREPTMKLID